MNMNKNKNASAGLSGLGKRDADRELYRAKQAKRRERRAVWGYESVNRPKGKR